MERSAPIMGASRARVMLCGPWSICPRERPEPPVVRLIHGDAAVDRDHHLQTLSRACATRPELQGQPILVPRRVRPHPETARLALAPRRPQCVASAVESPYFVSSPTYSMPEERLSRRVVRVGLDHSAAVRSCYLRDARIVIHLAFIRIASPKARNPLRRPKRALRWRCDGDTKRERCS